MASAAGVCPAAAPPAEIQADRSEAESAGGLSAQRLRGKAHYENGDFKPAIEAFRRCVVLDPDSAADRYNLALALMRDRQYDESLIQLAEAAKREPELLPVHYLRGIITKRQEKYAEAIASLEFVLGRDAECLGAHYNVGVCYKYVDDYEKARTAFEAAVRVSPDHPSSHYQLITVYRRLGRAEDAERHHLIYQRIKDTLDESEKTVEALERSTYSDLMVPLPAGPSPPPPAGAQVRFVNVSAEWGFAEEAKPAIDELTLPWRLQRAEYSAAAARRRYLPAVGGAVALGDYDGDGDLDIYRVNCSADPTASANRLYRNDGTGRFSDVTHEAGVSDCGLGLDAVFGDFDNDGKLDLYVTNDGPNVLYHNRGDGRYQDVSPAAGANEPQFGRRAVWFDYDHDNDLDLFVGNDVDLADVPEGEEFRLPDDFAGQPNTLLRNHGDGAFADRTDEAGLLVDLAQTRDLVFADFDGDQDTDLFVVNADAASTLFLNARMGRFSPGGSFTPPIDKHATAAAEADFNHDGRPDVAIAIGGTLLLYTNDGRAGFTGRAIPTMDARGPIQRIVVLDFNNDGWSDLLMVRRGGPGAPSLAQRAVSGRGSLVLLAATGPATFQDVTAASGLDTGFGDVADAAAGDLDGDGDEDLVLATRDRGLVLLRNDGGNRGRWLDVRLVGKKVNRCGIGAAVEVAAADGHYQRKTMRGGRLHFGLGRHERIDVVRVTWPDGVAQNVIEPTLGRPLEIEESVKVSASCAFLYACNGHGFELINEILGVGPLGVPMAPGLYHQPDCTELTLIEGHRLAARDGRYELRLTEELRETVYADMITLRVIDHPAGLEIVPNEMFTAPPFPQDKFFAAGDARPPRSAANDRGDDVLALVTERDGRFPTFPLTHYPGLAEPHSLTVDLGDLADAAEIILFLDGWIHWPESSTVMAVAQDPRYEVAPLTLEVRDPAGRWHTAVESVGLPTSKGAVVPVELTGKFLCDDYHVRLSTNLCVYVDRVFVSTQNLADPCRVSELPVAGADLRYRGFSRMTRDEFGFERFNYHDVSRTGSWDQAAGLYTRYGPVTELLARPDDRYVIFGPGDELALSFDAATLPKLPAGWKRDFIFYANGWVKDGDLNTMHSATVTPLPFHGMSGYPYPDAETYPDTEQHRRYQQTYNTREARATTGPLPARAR